MVLFSYFRLLSEIVYHSRTSKGEIYFAIFTHLFIFSFQKVNFETFVLLEQRPLQHSTNSIIMCLGFMYTYEKTNYCTRYCFIQWMFSIRN